MFHRRLLLLTGVMLLVLGVLGTATTMLATGESHAAARELAESKLSRQAVIQTKRGAILDRDGLVLAEDSPGWELAIHFDVLNGRWGYKPASPEASRDKLVWGEMSKDQREARVARLQVEYDDQVRAMFETLAELSGLSFEQLQDRRRDIVERVHLVQAHQWERWRQEESKERGEPVPLEQVAKPVLEETEHHVLLSDLSDDLRLLIEKFMDEGRRAKQEGGESSRSALPWTMVELRRATVRRYPMDVMTVELDRSTLPGPMKNDEPVQIKVEGVGLHLIGMMRDAWGEEITDKPFRDRKGRYQLAGYKTGDMVGRFGIEQSMEQHLRGSRGLRTFNLNDGRTMQEVEPVAGRDVTTTIDIRLQAQIQAIMKPEFGLMQVQPWHLKTDDPQELLHQSLNGGAVVIDIASGDVIAAVSAPEAPRSLLIEDPELLWNDPINQPMVNRALARPYQPGSTVKPLVLAASLAEGVLGESETVDTPGYLWADKPTVFRDWYWKQFQLTRGFINGATAIEVSSNPFFGMMAERLIKRLGRDGLVQWYRRFGLGQKPGTGLAEEISGALGPRNRELEHNEACFMAIGQGPVSWTPLQAATAYMRLASGELDRVPRLVASPVIETEERPTNGQLPAVSIRTALEGMRRSANSVDGTTHHITDTANGMNREPIFNVEGVTVMAKSGTADPGNARWIDFNRNGEIDEGEVERSPRDHAWVVVLVQPDGAPRPTHVIACVVEYAGSGGRVAGPVVNQIVHALKRHHYLDWPLTR